MLQLSFVVVAVVGIGWLIGATNLPGDWYAGLAKPGFVPPNWAFPVAWTILYILIAIASTGGPFAVSHRVKRCRSGSRSWLSISSGLR